MPKVTLIEDVNYNFYKDILDLDLFEWLRSLDPTKEKTYSKWILNTFISSILKPQIEWWKKVVPEDYKLPKPPYSKSELYNVNQYIIVTFSIRSKERGWFFHRFFEEDAQKITEDLKAYTKLKNKKLLKDEREYNIMNMKHFWNLSDLVINKYSDVLDYLALQEPIDPSEANKLYEDKEWLVVVPLTHKAACKYGANTKWCTASRNDDSDFAYYTGKGKLYIVINKKDKWKRQLHMETNQWMDELDQQVPRMGFIKSLSPEVKQVLFTATGKFLFDPDFEKEIKEWSFSDSFITICQSYLGASEIQALKNADIELPFIKEDYKMALFDYYTENNYDYSEAYDYGYDNPKEFIDEPPENAETCENCNGSGFSLPYGLTKYQAENIRPDIKDVLKFYTQNFDGSYELTDLQGSTAFAKEKRFKCKTCQGKGFDASDPESYSEEQRERAGYESESDSMDSDADESSQYFYHDNLRNYGKDFISDIYDRVWNLTLERKETHKNLDVILNLLTLSEDDYDVNWLLDLISKEVEKLKLKKIAFTKKDSAGEESIEPENAHEEEVTN